MITIRFACGHQGQYAEQATATPRCGCGETRVQRVSAPPPRFRGFCTGPVAQTVALEPHAALLKKEPV